MKKKLISTEKIVFIGIMSALTVVMGLFGIGFIPLPTFKATIMHLPVIIGAIVGGPVVGAIIGLIFGLFSMYQNVINPNLMSPMFLNPLVSVLPRILIGITSYYTYYSLKKFFKYSSIGVGALVGSLTNTIGVLGSIFLLYSEGYASVKGISASAVGGVILTTVMTNGLIEAIVAVIIVVPVVLAIKKLDKQGTL